MFHSIILKVRRLDDSGAWSTGIHGWLGLMGHEGVVRVVYQMKPQVYTYTVFTLELLRCGVVRTCLHCSAQFLIQKGGAQVKPRAVRMHARIQMNFELQR